MTLILDTSALLKRYLDEDGTEVVLDLMSADDEWCASALALAEAHITLCHTGLDSTEVAQAHAALRDDWLHLLVVPVDDLCLARSREIGCAHMLRTLDAIHLAAAERLPGPARFLTFDRRQRAAAEALGLELAHAEG